MSFVSSFGFGGGTVEDPCTSNKNNAADDTNPVETFVEVSGAGEYMLMKRCMRRRS